LADSGQSGKKPSSHGLITEQGNEMSWTRYWTTEPPGKWQPIEDRPDVQDRAREKGAMFLTCHAIDGDPAQDPPPNRRGDMHLDFDSDTEPGLVLEEMVKAIAHLETAYGVDPYQLEVFLSGGKGGHIEIPAIIVGIEPGPFLHLEQKRFACKLAADLDLKTLDVKIYSGKTGRQFRLPNVKRKNGRYKVQIMPSELAGLHGKELMELTREPRILDLDELPNEPTLAEPLKDLFLYFRDQVKAEQAALADREPLDADTVKKLKSETPPCINATLRLTSRPPKGNFNQIILNLATYFNVAGADLGTALETSWAFLEGYQDSTVYKTQDARIRHFKEMFLYVQGNPRFVFNCGFSLGLGLPGNWFDCGACQLSERKPKPEPGPEPEPQKEQGKGVLNIRSWIVPIAYQGQPEKRQFLVNRRFPMGQASLVAAAGGIGKTIMGLGLGVAVTAEEDELFPRVCFGGEVLQHGSAALIFGEDDRISVHNNLLNLGGLNNRKLLAVPMPSAGGAKPFFRLDPMTREPRATDDWKRLCDQLIKIPDLKLFEVDPLQVVCLLDLNSPENAQFVCSHISELAAETAAAVLLTHHFRKTKVMNPETAREAIRGTTGLVDGVRAVYALWEPSDDKTKGNPRALCRHLGVPYSPGKVVQGAIVKANNEADRRISTFVRNETGILQDRTNQLYHITGDDLNQLLIEQIAQAARDGRPYTKTASNGVYERKHEFPEVCHGLGKHKIREMIDDLLEQGDLVMAMGPGSNSVKWLDIPGGPFAEGNGNFVAGHNKKQG
jgi:hypothetical protein